MFKLRRHSGNTRFESTIAGGLPVVVVASICPPEPDVGIFEPYAADLEIFDSQGRPAPWAHRRATRADLDRLAEEALYA